MPAPFLEAWVSSIIQDDVQSSRFERFCVDLFSIVDDEEYVPTSVSWDLGKDGRSARLSDDTPILCASLRGDVSSKAKSDLQRLQETSPPKKLRFCSSQKISENRREQVTKELKALCPNLEVTAVDGIDQLAPLAHRHPAPFLAWYKNELDNLRLALAQTVDGGAETEITGMRIALTTQLSSDAQAFREDLLENLTLTAVTSKGVPLASISNKISMQLHLGRKIPESYFVTTIDRLRTSTRNWKGLLLAYR